MRLGYPFKLLPKVITIAVMAVAAVYIYLLPTKWNPSDFRTAADPALVPTLESQPAKIVLKDALMQPYSYLAEGGQMVAFVSADGNYVLKFFKFCRFMPSRAVAWCGRLGFFPDYCARHTAKRRQKMVRAFDGSHIAYTRNCEASGLLYVDLHGNTQLSVELADSAGVPHIFSLDKVPFLLQRRSVQFSDVLAEKLLTNDLTAAKELVKRLHRLFSQEYAKGIFDADHGIMHNIGVIDGELIHLDVGRMVYDEKVLEPKWQERELALLRNKVYKWLQSHFLESADDVIASFSN